MFRRLGRPGMPLVLHPDAWRDRRIVFPTGTEIHMPPPSRADLAAEGVDVVEERGPSLLLDGTVLVSGQTERVTDFEKGFPVQDARTDDGWEPDPWIWDDQSVIVHVRGKGWSYCPAVATPERSTCSAMPSASPGSRRSTLSLAVST
jgi:7,8-dihydropterin-6-yl-methyl-4-(beta-D-ribofuranosyl)aminobenzene 5'-phosphate synthase